MSQNPFEILEKQLRQAVAARAPQRERRLRRGGLALVLVALIGGGTVATAAVLRADRPSAVQQAIAAGLNAAQKSPACQPTDLRSTKLKIISGGADPLIAQRYEIFRRATRASDRTANLQFGLGSGQQVLRDTIRVARAADGARFEMAISQGPARFASTDPVACAAAAKRYAVAHVPADDVALRRHVTRIMNGRLASARRNTAPTTQILSVRSPSIYNRSASASVATFIRDGRIPPSYSIRTDRHHGRAIHVIAGLVPDPVASIRVIDRAGPPAKRAPTVTVPVQDNVYDIALARDMGPKVLLQWQAPNGHVLKTLHPNL